MSERRLHPWRQRLWTLVYGPRVLEVGVGTGKNMPFWPPEIAVTAIDLTPGMLVKAQHRAAELKISADLRLGDVQALEFPDASFDVAVATMDVLNPLVVRVMGANINRRTVENIQRAGWSIEHTEDLGLGGIIELIIAQP